MRKIMLMLLMLFTSFMGVKAQDMKVTGKVTDATTGNPVAFATVTVKGNSKGVATDANGDFSISAGNNAILVITSVGYQRIEMQATDGIANVVLTKQNNDLSEVVVVGYGTQKRATLTGSVVQLNNATLIKRQVSSASQVL